MRLKIVLLAIFLFSLCLLSLSASPQDEPTVASAAKRVDHYYDHLHGLQVRFEETYEGMGTSRTEQGTLFLRKPSSMRWDYEQPNRKLFLVDGKFAYFYVTGDSKAERMDARKMDDLRSPLRFLLGRTHLESELTGLRLTQPSATDFGLEGVPKGMENRVAKVSLTANSAGQISSLRIEERDGAVTTFKFSDFNPNPHFAPDLFHFEAPPGVTIVQSNLQ